jgi:hypothetical protein
MMFVSVHSLISDPSAANSTIGSSRNVLVAFGALGSVSLVG